MNMGCDVLSEIRQAQRMKSHFFTYKWNVEVADPREFRCQTEGAMGWASGG
jgi:hypothetical protein